MKRILSTFAAVVLGLAVSLADADVRFFAAAALGTTVLYSGGTTTLIASNTIDGADNASLAISGGGANSASRGGRIVVAGNEAASGGYVQIYGGNTTTGDVSLLLNNASAGIKLYNSSTAVMWNFDNNAAQLFVPTTAAITSATADAADTGTLYLSGGGGGTGVGSARGALIGLAGNESGSTGAVSIIAGNVSGGNIDLATNGATSFSITRSSNADLTFNKASGIIRANTSDAADTSALKLSGGGNIDSPSRGAFVSMYGNETTNGRLHLGSGNGGSADTLIDTPVLYIRDAAGAIRWTIGDTLVGASTSSIGWTIQAAANQACNTTCVTPCVFGQETTSKAILACTDATADSCLCAGAS